MLACCAKLDLHLMIPEKIVTSVYIQITAVTTNAVTESVLPEMATK